MVRFQVGAKEVCLVQGVQPGSATYSNPVGTIGLSAKIKRTDREGDQSLPSSVQFKNDRGCSFVASYPS